MIIKNFTRYFFVFTLFITSCSNPEKKDNLERLLPNGTYKSYYNTGELKETGEYINGKKSDSIVEYYKSGKLKQISFLDGSYTNVKRFWEANSLLKEKGKLYNAKKIGWWTQYNLEGQVFLKEEFILFLDKSISNQSIYFSSKDSIDYSLSHFHLKENNFLKYYSPLDTNKLEYGTNRYILFKFLNDSLNKEFFFNEKKELNLDRLPYLKVGVIEETVFLPSDTIIEGEKAKRIIKLTQKVSF